MANTKSKVIAVAKKEVGYLEKKSNKYLDYKKKNAGYRNYTKYNRDMKKIRKAGTLTDYWCANFVSWCFAKAYGVKEGKKLMLGYSNYVPYIYNHFKEVKRTYKSPKAGDIVIFHNQSHVGLCIKVSGGTVYTIEGNTSGGGFNANGGAVCKKSYPVGSSLIFRYCRPKYAKTVSEYPEVKYGDKNAYVGKAKKMLTYLGYEGMSTGNGFGKGTLKAVKKFQKKKKLKVDGVIGAKTWNAIATAYSKKKKSAK